MLEILIIRHGETAWNTANIFRGRVQIGLSEEGLKQAEKLANISVRRKLRPFIAVRFSERFRLPKR